jgi:hypothetical protein
MVNATPWPLYPWGKKTRYPFYRRLGGPTEPVCTNCSCVSSKNAAKWVKLSMKSCHLRLYPLFLDVPTCKLYWHVVFTDASVDAWRNSSKEVTQYAFHISNVHTGNIPSTSATEMSKLFSRNMLLYCAVPHSLIWSNNSLKAGQVGGVVSGWYVKYVASKCALFPESHCDMQLRSTLLHSIPGASGSILDEDFLYPNWRFVVWLEVLKAASVKIFLYSDMVHCEMW